MDEEGKPKKGFHFLESQNWYSYVNNNPVKYYDPNGLLTIQFGLGGTLGGGGWVTFEAGIGFSISKEKGVDIGVYYKGGVGSYMGGALTGDASLTVSAADELTDMRGETITTGGSGNATIAGLPGSVGGEISVPLGEGEQKNTSATGTVSLGLGTPGEGHIIYTDTKLFSVKEQVTSAVNTTKDAVKSIFGRIENFVKDFIPEWNIKVEN